MKRKLKIAIAGNPNSGKTSIFNKLTGSHQKVANYPGVTVEVKKGSYKWHGREIEVIDLPGTYSLSVRSEEERVARKYIVFEKPDLVINIVDSSNFERNFYLTTQLIEMGLNIIVVLNMADLAISHGQQLDVKMLQERLRLPVLETVGSKGKGVDELKTIIENSTDNEGGHAKIEYGDDIERAIYELIPLIHESNVGSATFYNCRWLALKLLEADELIIENIKKEHPLSEKILEKAYLLRKYLARHLGDALEVIIAERRYGFISGLYRETAITTIDEKVRTSDKVDDIIIHRYIGIPIFLGIMYFVFYLTFTLGQYPMGWIESGISWFADFISASWPANYAPLLKSMLIDGVIGGVGGLTIFLPNILILFLAISILEDSGYLARGAFIVDRLMHKIGLHGKSFIPMIIGFGCSVPGILATRTLENKEDRMTTMMVLPLMSCGARIPVYTLIIVALFPPFWQAKMLFLIYIIGIFIAVLLAKILRLTIFRGANVPFVMELPPYRMPTINGLFMHMWERTFLYVKKAGTIILAVSIIMWALSVFPQKNYTDVHGKMIDQSFMGIIGKKLEYVFKPIGFDWKISTALVGSLAAKEVFVAQLGVVYSLDDNKNAKTLRQKLYSDYSPLVGFCIMLFILIATPCMATFAAIKKESGSWRWAFFQWFGLTAIAYLLCLIVFQMGSLLIE